MQHDRNVSFRSTCYIHNNIKTSLYRIGTYLRLVILSMAFPYAVKKGIVRESYVAETVSSFISISRRQSG